MSLRAMINSLIGGRTLDDGGPRAAVLEVVTGQQLLCSLGSHRGARR